MRLSVIIPMRNEAPYAEKCINEVRRAVEALTNDYKIIVAEDGSTDGTDLIMAELAQDDPHIIHLHSKKKLGKGRAITKALTIVENGIVAFIDADLPLVLRHLPELVDSVQRTGGIAVASRLVKGATVKRPLSRKIASTTYNLIVRILFHDHVKDHQCGLKVFNRKVLDDVLPKVKSPEWVWDTEVIVRAKMKNFPITEIPITYRDCRDPWKSNFHLIRDGLKMCFDVLKLWKEIRFKEHSDVPLKS